MKLQSSLTPVEVADLLKITKNTVYELIKRGELPSYKIGKKIRVDLVDVENYINFQKNKYNVINNTPAHQDKVDNKTIIISGQDIILDILAKHIEKNIKNISVLRSHIGSYNGLYELYHDRVSISSTHLWDGDLDEYNSSFIKKLLPGIPCTLINLAYRIQGFYVAKGNPKNINTWSDLTKNDVKFINREKGSGTRILIDEKLRILNISSSDINGYTDEESSHLSISSVVSRGSADVGVGNEKVALQVNSIDFIPLQKERYDLVIKKEHLSSCTYKSILSIINSIEFKNEIKGLGGYDISDTGKIISDF